MTHKQAYKTMLREYPDVLDVGKMCELLDVGVKTAYKLLQDNKIAHLKIGRAYRIPKAHIIDYLLAQNYSENK